MVSYYKSNCSTAWSGRVWLDVEAYTMWTGSTTANRIWYQQLFDACKSTAGVSCGIYSSFTTTGKTSLAQLRTAMATLCLCGMLTTTAWQVFPTSTRSVAGPSLGASNTSVTPQFAVLALMLTIFLPIEKGFPIKY